MKINIQGSIISTVAVSVLSLVSATPTNSIQPTATTVNQAAASVAPSTTQEAVIGPVEIKSAEYVAPAPDPTPTPAVITLPVGGPPANIQPVGSKNDWLAASGIPSSDWNYVDFIISRESGWNPNSTNSTSGAHGLPQALPYSKTGCGWVDAVCQLRWANGYAIGKYGSWAGAYNYWLQHNYW